MGFNIPLGRIAGIKVGTDLTVPILAALYTVTLAVGHFPNRHPDLAPITHWSAGVVGAVLFFASLLVHELAHALVAREEGVGVLGIKLWFLGGMARLESSPQTAAGEFRIAVVGPLSSAACGIVLLCGSYLLGDTGVAALYAELFRLLGFINLVLAGFNLIPAAPLDGGTVLSAIVWRRTGSRARGLRVAAYAGLVVAAVLVWRGFTTARGSDIGTINGWVIIAVGAFIGSSAFRMLRASPLYELLEGVTVADAMAPITNLARRSITVADFVATLAPDDESDAFPVIDEHGELSGLLLADAIRAVPHETRNQLRVEDLAFGLDRLTIIESDRPLLTSLQRLDSADLDRGVAIDRNGTVVGLIDPGALGRTIRRHRDATVPAR